MALISVDKAANRLGVPLETIEEWARKGLLAVRSIPAGNLPLGAAERMVDESDLDQIAESMGWLQISTDKWDHGEEE